MAINGQAIKQDVFVLNTTGNNTGGLQPLPSANNCDYFLPALAEYTYTDDHFNDQHSVIWFFDELFTETHIHLQSKNTGAWADVAELTGNTYGKLYAYGFFINKFNEKAHGYLLDWSKVLNEQGPGAYRVRASGVKSIGTFDDQYSFEFELRVYTPDRADKTTRVQWNRSGVLGNRMKDEKIDDYGTLNWFNQIRIPNSIFGLPTSDLVKEYVVYPNGSNVWLSDKQVEELTWEIYQLPSYVHRFIQVDIMQAGQMTFSDYNKLNPTQNVDRIVVPTAGYKPEWQRGTVNANVTVTFKPYFENLTHKRE